MQVTLLGTGDTAGTPVPRCDCATCERARETGQRRSRFSVHVKNERTGQRLLIDASPDFRQQFLDTDVALPDAAIITHVHFDHLDGLGNVYRLLDRLPVHAANETDPETGESVAETVRRRYNYLHQVEVFPETPFEPFEAAGFEITLVPVVHPPLLSYGLRVEGEEAVLSLTGDTSYAIPERSQTVLSGADLLLAEAIVPAAMCEKHPLGGRHPDENGVYRSFGTKHMTREGALDMAERLDAEQVRLVHLSHRYPAEQAFGPKLGVDGEQIVL
ncbi:MBL fold metallo-hydrolase [Halodesulfurarchaeum formicicum]|uniref:ATP-binding protein n=1 Tax=Halodesulfurarchaeum formicicum TaxID=1873524 RepID=A0A1J1AE30_9EURY|nr:MBL fold metallo-hydrolase [Halodesulfurarchaeum formicicum]APE96410.1 ATP-binding protein [Halodesulfurarchaeum formicicum]